MWSRKYDSDVGIPIHGELANNVACDIPGKTACILNLLNLTEIEGPTMEA